MNLADIFAAYTPGSTGFCIAVETYCAYEITRAEIERIAVEAHLRSPDTAAAEFQAIWGLETWWTDENTAAVNAAIEAETE